MLPQVRVRSPDCRVAAGPGYLRDTWSFDPSTAAWTSVGSSTGTRPGFGGYWKLAAAKGGDGRSRLYLHDGWGRHDPLWSFDPQTLVWTEITVTVGVRPEGRRSHGWTGVGSKLYLFGGYDYLTNELWESREMTNELWEFSTANASWAQLATRPAARMRMCFGSSGGLIYLLGGVGGSYYSGGYLHRRDFWSYNPANDSWSERTGSVTVEGSNLWPRYGGVLLDVAGELLLVQGIDPGIAPILSRFWHQSAFLTNWLAR